jgi:hypothetical protein
MDSSQPPYSVLKDFFEFGFKLDERIAISDLLSAIMYSGELILPVLLTTESCNSPHDFSGELIFVINICTISLLLFYTEIR